MAHDGNEPVTTPRKKDRSREITVQEPAAKLRLEEAGEEQRQAGHPHQMMPAEIRENGKE